MDAILDSIGASQLREVPKFGAGDTVRVHVRVVEGEKERVQVFEGVVLQRKGDGIHETFTVRKIGSGGIGIERVFPLHTPRISEVEVLRRGKIRQAKIFYMRGLRGRAARITERRDN